MMAASFFPFRKLGVYAKRRLLTVAFLWIAAGGVLRLFSVFVESLSGEPHRAINPLGLGAFVDHRLLVVLSVGVLAIAGLLSLVLMNITPNSDDQNSVVKFISRLWDEVSAAATHAGAALVSAAVFFPDSIWEPNISMAVRCFAITLYFMIGYFAFHLDDMPSPAVPAGGGSGVAGVVNAASTPPSVSGQPPGALGGAPDAQTPAQAIPSPIGATGPPTSNP